MSNNSKTFFRNKAKKKTLKNLTAMRRKRRERKVVKIEKVASKNDMTVLASCNELNADMATKMIALGCSGIFLEKECTNKELNDFARDLAGKVGSLGIGNISDLSPENLRTSNQETAAMTGVPLAGYDSILPMWRH